MTTTLIPRPRLLAGIALSMLAHLVLLCLYRVPVPAAQPEPARAVAVWLRPPKPEPKPEVPKQLARPVATSRQASSRPPTAMITMPEAVLRPADSALAPPASPAPVPDRQFDMDQARKQARKLANGPDPGVPDTALTRLAARREAERSWQTKAERAMEGAHRSYCKDGMPGIFAGVLAPINMVFDKKDSGCKL